MEKPPWWFSYKLEKGGSCSNIMSVDLNIWRNPRPRSITLQSHLPIGSAPATDPGLLRGSRLSSRLPHDPCLKRNLEKGFTGAMSCLRNACWDRAAPADTIAQVIPRLRWRTRVIRGKLLGKNTLVWLLSRPWVGHRPPGSCDMRTWLRPLLPGPPPDKMEFFH